MREEVSTGLQSQLRGVHLRLLYGVTVGLGESLTSERKYLRKMFKLKLFIPYLK